MNLHHRDDFLTFTSVFLFGLLLITVGLAHAAGIKPLGNITWTVWDFLTGAVAGVLMMAVFGLISPLRQEAEDILGAPLAACRWYDLALMAILVGIIEELLFRGVLEPWMARWNALAAFVIVNVIFGALHSVSLLYAAVATTLGCILSWLTHGIGEFNLLRPIVAHAVYDFVGFAWIAASYSRSHPSGPPQPETPD